MFAGVELSGWVLELETSVDAAPTFMNALDELALTVSSFEIDNGKFWQVSAMFAEMPDYDMLAPVIARAAASAGVKVPEFVVKPLEARDWLAENRASFQPIHAGRFFIHPTFYEGQPPAGSRAIALDAATAFGSGSHGTTKGCLLALDRIARRRRPRRILDMGCGSGILAIAAAMAWKRPVLAVDIDDEAVRVTVENARRNRVGNLLSAASGPGFDAPVMHRQRKFDLIVANILARPLISMAPALTRALCPGGEVVLSGLLTSQENQVIAAYRAQGLALVRRGSINDWSTLLLRRGRTVQAP
ncbi:MAG: 50S ribosomal protein L11 methyltransferase [Alphaproteobacteria bacterium]|nr:50S ribosomal protein L11 methyltransferase [Alphaproteobacteria bacterium]